MQGAMVAEKDHLPWAHALEHSLAVAKSSIYPVHCNSVPYELPNQIKSNDKYNKNMYVTVVEYL